MPENTGSASPGPSISRLLIPYALATWFGFLAIGIPLPVLSLFTHNQLGFDPLIVGIVIGAQSLATFASRPIAGKMCDARGVRSTTFIGLGMSSLAGACYLMASRFAAMPDYGLAILLAGRILLGLGESMFITALAVWSVARVGGAHAGRAMAWSGIAMYAALALGAPVGVAVYQAGGLFAVALLAIVMPLAGAGLTVWLDPVVVTTPQPTSYAAILRRIWVPGLGMALASSGVGTITAFLTLHFAAMRWLGAGEALMAFGCAYIAMRLLFGGLPDRFGGFATALGSLSVEAAGLLVIWAASSPLMAILGATLTGLGYSLVFPSLGVDALARTPDYSRGMVMGAYLACFDLGLALAGPLAGSIAQAAGLRSVFPAAAAAAVSATLLISISRFRYAASGARTGIVLDLPSERNSNASALD